MDKKQKIALCVLVLYILALLVWSSTAERRYVGAVRGLKWSEEWANDSFSRIELEYNGLPVAELTVTDPIQQQQIFEALQYLSFEGKGIEDFSTMPDDKCYSIRIYGTDIRIDGREHWWVYFRLMTAPPATRLDSRPRYTLDYSEGDIVIGGVEELLKVTQALLGIQ